MLIHSAASLQVLKNGTVLACREETPGFWSAAG